MVVFKNFLMPILVKQYVHPNSFFREEAKGIRLNPLHLGNQFISMSQMEDVIA